MGGNLGTMLSYLDANSGSMLASVLAGGAAGAAVAAKVGWRRVAGRFSRADDAASEETKPVSSDD